MSNVQIPGIRFSVLPVALMLVVLTFLAGCQIGRTPARLGPPHEYRVIGYVGGGADIWRIDAARLTHINYAFARVSEAGEIYFHRDRSPAHIAQLQALKRKNPHLKLLVSVGGWGADHFSDAALSDSSRQKFAQSAVDMVERYALDGIDLDWEYPGQPGPGIKYREEDRENFTLMLKTVREHLDSLSNVRGLVGENRLLLTIASNDDAGYFEHTEMEKLHVYLDFINVMTYDFFTSGSKTTGHHTGLLSSAHSDAPPRTAEAAINLHLGAGIPSNKIVLGVAFYGRGWTGVKGERTGLNQPYERFTRAYSYRDLLENYIDRRGFARYWDEAAKAPYLWNPDSTTFISYEDTESLRNKAEFVRAHDLGGIMYWEHSHDPDEELLGAIHDVLSQ